MLQLGVLLLVPLITLVVCPRLLGRGSWRLRFPRLCLILWYGSFLVGVTTVGCAVLLSVRAGVTARIASERAGWVGPTADTVLAWVSMGAAGVMLSIVAPRLVTMVVTHRRVRADFDRLTLVRHCRAEKVAGLMVHVVPSDEIVVVSVRGLQNSLLISSRVHQALTPGQLRAVVEHENAHLRGFHDVISWLAALNSACLPHTAAAVTMRKTTALLIEIIADREAARTVGQDLAEALLRMAELHGPGSTAETLQLRAALST